MTVNHFPFVLTAVCVLLGLGPKLAGSSNIGFCYGIHKVNMPLPAKIVSMYQSHQIGRMRLEEPDHEIFNALRRTGIQLSVGVQNKDIIKLAKSSDAAVDWVAQNIRAYWPDVHFRYIIIGNEIIPGRLAQSILPAIKNLHEALSPGGLWQRIKVTTVVGPAVLVDKHLPPSAANFSKRAVIYMKPIARYLDSIGAPLLANVYPYFNYIEKPKATPLEYALFVANNEVIVDCGRGYRNSFDAIVDAFYTSLEKVGVPNLRVAVSETGWPSSGNKKVARMFYAWIYNTNVIKHVLSSQGTPKRPGAPIETYLFSMFSDDRKFGGSTLNDFGLFNPDMTPVYPIDFNATMY